MLHEHNVIEKEPAAVARFLLETSNLSKTAIGEYLGDHAEFNLNVRTIPLSSRKKQQRRECVCEKDKERGERLDSLSLSFPHCSVFL